MHILTSYADLKSWRDTQTQSVALVPTMGALHDGHMSLVDIAQTYADITIAGIFVNPTQFAPDEDLDTYPRQIKDDCDLLKSRGADAVYIPRVEDIYPDGVQTTRTAGQAAQRLEGQFRPTHFDGVVTVVGALFDQIKPDTSVFGEKDYQQLCVLREAFPDQTIIGAPIIRDENGLALSSRNAYLSDAEYQIAVTLNRTLSDTAERVRNEAHDIDNILKTAHATLSQNGFSPIDYITLCHAETLAPLSDYQSPARLLAAAYVGKTRLIDNVAV